MTSYIIKSVLCSGILLLVYHLFLEREKMFRFNRFYLLASISFALVVPLISIEIEPDTISESVPIFNTTENFSNKNPLRFENVIEPTDLNWSEFLPIGIYAAIALTLLTRLIRNLYFISSNENQVIISYHGAKLVLRSENTVTYTFMNYIFVSEKDFIQNKIREEVLTHELAHARQKHSVDLLFIEFIHALFWLNPLLILYRKAIQLNHEFLADEAVLAKYNNIKNYQLLLLDNTLSSKQLVLTSGFNYSITKKRIAMMTKKVKRSRQVMKQASVIILTLILVFVFSEKIYSQIKREAATTKSKETKKSSFTVETTHEKRTKSGPGISDKLMEEFNFSVKQYGKIAKTSKGKTYQDFYETPVPIKKQLYGIYLKMNPQQQKETKLAFFEDAIPSKVAPTPEVFETWKNPKTFGIWIDEKHVTNKELDKYKNTDFAESSLSKLYGRAKRGVIYKYQLDLTTNKEFDRTYQARVNDRIWIRSNPFLQE